MSLEQHVKDIVDTHLDNDEDITDVDDVYMSEEDDGVHNIIGDDDDIGHDDVTYGDEESISKDISHTKNDQEDHEDEDDGEYDLHELDRGVLKVKSLRGTSTKKYDDVLLHDLITTIDYFM